MAYDSKKAALYNKLIKDGVSEDAALAQAGIGDADFADYAIGMNGEMGALIIGTGPRPGVTVVTGRNQPAEVDYDQDPTGEPAQQPSKKNVTYTTTSTETVSGGGTTTVISNQPKPTATSQVYAREGTAKQAEIDQFIKDNPSNFARKRQGLPPLTPEENEARAAKLRELEDQRSQIYNQEQAAKEPVPPSVIRTPNTTTTTTTVVSGQASTNQAVNYTQDEKLNQDTELAIDNTLPTPRSAASANSPEQTNPIYVSVQTPQGNLLFPDQASYDAWQSNPQSVGFSTIPGGQLAAILPPEDTTATTDVPTEVSLDQDPGEAERLRRAQEFDTEAPTLTAEDVGPMDAGVEAQLEFEQEQNRALLEAENYQPEPVNLDDDPAVRELDEASRADAAERFNEMSDPDGAYEAETKARLLQAQQQATIQDRLGQNAKGDWRVRLRIAPDATYLYQDKSNTLLAPLRVSDGVVFPYTPIINTNYAAKYDPYDLTHSNYRGYFYRGSQVSDINIQATFTAQDTREAEYVLAVIHFFRSATKMFYGQDRERGAPPPLVYLRGYGEYQFNDHACVISNFQYNLPNDVDYISISPNNVGLNLSNRQAQVGSSPVSTISSAIGRLSNLFNVISGQPGVPRGAKPGERADLGVVGQTVYKTGKTTYVPTKIDLSITLLPVQTRSQVSKQFSVKEFSNGNLLKKGFW